MKLALEELKQESASGTQAQLQVASVGSTPFESPDGAYIYYVVRVVRQGPEGAEDPDTGRVLVPSHPAAPGRREAR